MAKPPRIARILRWLWRGPRAVLMAVAATFGPPRPPPPPREVAAQVDEEAER